MFVKNNEIESMEKFRHLFDVNLASRVGNIPYNWLDEGVINLLEEW
mgnify:CR=1 FL=1|jgi:hypothetical protein